LKNDIEAHEAGLAAFVVRNKRDRILWLLGTEKGRTKLREQLPHFSDWDPHTIMPIQPSEQTPSRIAHRLRAEGAPSDVYLLSAEPQLDGRRMLLEEALTNVVGAAPGTVIFCIPAKLGYFEGENQGDRHILLRR
jgi:hypothetical protein